MSDVLSAGDFLGKFDRDTIERKLAARERMECGFTLFILSAQQASELERLARPQQDLTWSRRAATGVK